MLRIDKAILDANGVICDNIACFGATERGLLSQNILGHIRNFVEYVAIKAHSNGADVNPNDYNLNVAALKDMQRRGNLRFLYRFHELLQKSVSHYTVDKDGSERLMLKYYEHLLKIKLYLKQTYNLDVLGNIENFPLNTDTELSDYYTKIAERIESPSKFSYAVTYNDRYYVQKVKPFFINQKIYYEVTFTAATANTSKFDRVRKHPHVRGEDHSRNTARSFRSETPPRAWGRPVRGIAHRQPLRNTPTCVGKTIKSGNIGFNRQKHPHVRGEDILHQLTGCAGPETPPRAWGRQNMADNFGNMTRNTPTCVGKTHMKL